MDDAAFMRMLLKEMLEAGGHEVVCTAANGQEAIEKYQTWRPDVVTMDITMPVMEGVEAVERIIGKYPDATIIMCSAVGHKVQILDAIRAGAKDFIVKPLQPARVLEAVSKALKTSRPVRVI